MRGSQNSMTKALRALASSDLAVGIVVCLPIAALYLAGVQRAVGRGDAAEFVIAARTLGIPHPTGYPIYIWLGRLFSLLPIGSIPFRVNLMSAVFASLGLVVLFLIVAREIHRLVRDRAVIYICAILAVALVGFSRTFWQYAEVAEVYPLNALCVLLSVCLVLGWLRTGRTKYLYGSSLALGISLGTHLSNIFFVPVFLGVMFLAGRKARHARQIVGSVGLIALGASQYLYLLLRARQAPAYLNPSAHFFEWMPSTGTDNPLRNWMWFITGGPWHGHYTRSLGEVLAKARELLGGVLPDYEVAGLALALAGMALMFTLRVDGVGVRGGAGGDVGTGSEGVRDTEADKKIGQEGVSGGHGQERGDRGDVGGERRGGDGQAYRPGGAILVGVVVAQVAYYLAYRPSQIGMILPFVACVAVFVAIATGWIARLVMRFLPGPAASRWGGRTVAMVVAIVVWLPLISRPVITCSHQGGAAALAAQMICQIPPGSMVDGIDWKYGKIVDYYRIVEHRDIPFQSSACDQRALAEGKCYVLGTPKAVREYQRAGFKIEPFLSQEGDLTVYRVGRVE